MGHIHEQRFKDAHTFKAAVLQRVQPCVLQQLRQQRRIGAAQPGGYSLRHLPPELLTRVLRRVVCPKSFQPIADTIEACRNALTGEIEPELFYSEAVEVCRQVCKLFEAEAISLLESITIMPSHTEGFAGFGDLAVERMALALALQRACIEITDDPADYQLTPESLSHTLPACQSLQELWVKGYHEPTIMLRLRSRPKVPLYVHGALRVGQDQMQDPLSMFDACHFTALPACLVLALSGCPALRFLCLEDLSIDAASAVDFSAALQGLPELRMLRLWNVTGAWSATEVGG